MSHVAFGNPSVLHAGKIARRNTLFGELDVLALVANTSASESVLQAWRFQCATRSSVSADSGTGRTPAAVLGVLKRPSYTAPRTVRV